MKICYVSNNLESIDALFLNKLVEKNYEVHAISTRNSELEDQHKIEGIKYYELCRIQKFYEKRYHGFNPLWFFSATRIFPLKPSTTS